MDIGLILENGIIASVGLTLALQSRVFQFFEISVFKGDSHSIQ